MQAAFRGRKHHTTQNVVAAVDFGPVWLVYKPLVPIYTADMLGEKNTIR